MSDVHLHMITLQKKYYREFFWCYSELTLIWDNSIMANFHEDSCQLAQYSQATESKLYHSMKVRLVNLLFAATETADVAASNSVNSSKLRYCPKIFANLTATWDQGGIINAWNLQFTYVHSSLHASNATASIKWAQESSHTLLKQQKTKDIFYLEDLKENLVYKASSSSFRVVDHGQTVSMDKCPPILISPERAAGFAGVRRCVRRQTGGQLWLI